MRKLPVRGSRGMKRDVVLTKDRIPRDRRTPTAPSPANKLESAKNMLSSNKKHGPLAGQHGTQLSSKMAGREG